MYQHLLHNNNNKYELIPEARDGISGSSAQVSEGMIPVAVYAVKLSASPETAELLPPAS
jgi:hypothetical protein